MKKLLTTIAALGSSLAFAAPVYAQNLNINCVGSFSKLCKLNSTNLGGLISIGVGFLLAIAVVIALFFLVFGGIRWMTSGGDKAKVESARNHIIAALIGLVIAFLAFFILSLILSVFGVNLNSISLPHI
jgi:hypothetical protein